MNTRPQHALMRAPLAIMLAMFLSLWVLAPAQATETTSASTSEETSATSGEASEPQPLSTADLNDGGANGDCPDGPYCSTRDGSASENGMGDGEATGKPCAGCVGMADNKNPQGEMPDGSDGNAGYECDRNEGVGQGNPAHTSCETADETDGTTGETGETGKDTGTETGASGETGDGDSTSDAEAEAEILGVEAGSSSAAGASAGGAQAQATASSQGLLPATGAGNLLVPLLLGGLGLLAAGAFAMLRHRRLGLGR